MARILIVDDEKEYRDVLREYAQKEGHQVFEAIDGMDAIEAVSNTNFDIIITDIAMPKLDGFSAVQEIKKIKDIPTIIISDRAEEYDKLLGFDIGIDDFITKPFFPREVMARVKAVLRRTNKNNKQVSTDGLEINIAARSVYIDGEKSELTPKEYELLFYLVGNSDAAVSREKLLTEVWGWDKDFYGDERTVDTHIKMLRKSLGKYRDKILTLRGHGYKIEL